MVENTATTTNHLNPQPGAPVGVAEPRSPDLADHFLWCSKLGRYLTVSDGSRFVITDDFRDAPMQPEAAAVASIYSKDLLVAQSALLPLGAPVHKMSPRKREKYERLFTLIEKQALSDVVRHSAREVLNAGFRNAEIRALEAELGDKLNPARIRYRAFLNVVKQLMDRNITAGPFLDEFRDFTLVVAGNLDFGIYSFCLDRMFGSLRIQMKVKKLLVLEILKYPPIIRRELLTNVLAYPGQARELIEFVKYMVATELGKNAVIEIELLEAFKLRRLSMEDIESSLLARTGQA
ncbi:MAG TPA: hypothetical protein EYP72_02280 [Rhodospirillales bacterium]|nr:hypothetical protein [Rhodospirillales bacterium]